MKFITDDPEDVIQKFLMKGQFYEVEELEVMKKYCPKNATILDIGANIGNHAVYFSKYFDAKTIYVFEPILRSYKMLLANLCLNYCHNVNVDYIGVALGHGNFTGYPYGKYMNNLGSVSISSEPMPKSEYKPIEIVRGDDLLENVSVDFIKIDVESMEMFVLEGLQKTIANSRPAIFIEVDSINKQAFLDWMEKNRYKSVWNNSYVDINGNYMLLPEN